MIEGIWSKFGSHLTELVRVPNAVDMIIYLVILILGLVALYEMTLSLFNLLQKIFCPYPMNFLGFRGKLVYIDDGNADTFLSNRYMISSRPDFIYKVGLGRYLLVEYKSTMGKVRTSHLNQSKAAALAVRQNAIGKKFYITQILVVTKNDRLLVKAGSNGSLWRAIKNEHRAVLKARKGHVFKPEFGKKCKGCPYKVACENFD